VRNRSGRAPYLLVLGNDASDGIRAALDALRADLDAWEEVGRSTDFADRSLDRRDARAAPAVDARLQLSYSKCG
jgi:hypothetical protein